MVKIWVCILHAVGHKFVYYLLCRYVSGVSPQNNAAQNWYCDMKGLVFFALWQFCWDTATSCFILFWEEQYLVLFVAWTSAVFYWPFLLKKYHFQLLRNYTSWFIFKIAGCNFHIIIQNIFILQFLGRFRVQAKQKAWEKCFADCSGGSSNSPDNTHAHTHLQKFWFLCLVIYLNQGHHCARGQAELALTLYLLIYSRL